MHRKLMFFHMIPIHALGFLVLLIVTLLGSKAVSVMADSVPLTNRHCIVIDAGHGGVDGGATSCTGVLESHLNLEISIRLNDLLRLLGYQTQMIRTEDISVYTKGDTIAAKKISDLRERVRIVNSTENAVLLSIHQNYFSDGRYNGAQIFYADTNGSWQLSQLLQKNFIANLNPGSNRQPKKASGIYLMERISCTGVLIECGFLSNVEEEGKLCSQDYQKKLCCVIAASIGVFLSS